MGIVIAIDGPAGAGKSTTAKEVARRLGFTYVDTGAMYRAVTLATLEKDLSVEDDSGIAALAATADIEFRWIDTTHHTYLNGRDVTREIRSAEVAERVSPVSAIPGVRKVLVDRQREMRRQADIVMEGRDIGTNVFPDAEFKFFLQADLAVRARRRIKDYQKIGQELNQDQIIRELRQRDQIDSSREHSPLKRADDAIIVDTTHLKFSEQVDYIVNYVLKRRS